MYTRGVKITQLWKGKNKSEEPLEKPISTLTLRCHSNLIHGHHARWVSTDSGGTKLAEHGAAGYWKDGKQYVWSTAKTEWNESGKVLEI